MTDIDDFVRGLELPYAPHKQGDIPLFPPEQMRAFAAAAIRGWEAQKAVPKTANTACQKQIKASGKPYPRTCPTCKLGPCHYEPPKETT